MSTPLCSDAVLVFDGATHGERCMHVLGASNYIYAEAHWSEGVPTSE